MKYYSQPRVAAVLGLLVAASVALPLGAVAQTTTAPSVNAPPVATPKLKHVGSGEAGLLKNMSKNVDEHIASLHSQLGITPAEETQWAQFAQVMRDNASQVEAAFSQRGQTLDTMNAVENLQSYAQISQVQSTNMQKLAASFQTLYASFPAAQQQVADGVFRAQKAKR